MLDRHNLILFLKDVDDDFKPQLSQKVDIESYVDKIMHNAILFVDSKNDCICALVVLYCNNYKEKIAHIPLVVVRKEYRSQHLATHLLQQAISYTKQKHFNIIEVNTNNPIALDLYCKNGFIIKKHSNNRYYLEQNL